MAQASEVFSKLEAQALESKEDHRKTHSMMNTNHDAAMGKADANHDAVTGELVKIQAQQISNTAELKDTFVKLLTPLRNHKAGKDQRCIDLERENRELKMETKRKEQEYRSLMRRIEIERRQHKNEARHYRGCTRQQVIAKSIPKEPIHGRLQDEMRQKRDDRTTPNSVPRR